MSEIMNAKIESVTLSMEDSGCLTYGLCLEMDKYSVVYGGVCIGYGYLGAEGFSGSGKGLEAMMRIMNVVGVSRWEDLNGKYCRIVSDGLGSTISKIGNIIEDKWFDQDEFFKEE